MNLGSWIIDDVVVFSVSTHTPSTGAVTDADSVPSYRVYEDETGTAILTGSMAKLDDANTTGFYSEQITLSAANGFEKGKSYNILITAAVGAITGATERFLQIGPQAADVRQWTGTNVATPDTAGYPKVTHKSGSGTGELDITSGVVKANLAQILGTALTETSGQIAAAFTKWFNVATPTGTVNSIPDAVAGAASGLALVGSNVGAATSVSGAVGSVTGAVGSVTGSVGSVTGAVGSVTGNVGGNVTGSVGSVASFGTLVADIATAVWGAVTRTLSAFAFTVNTNANATETATAAAVTALGSPLQAGSYTTPPTVGAIADAVWDEDLTGHTTDNSAGDDLGQAVVQAAAIYARLGAPSGLSMSADIAGVPAALLDLPAGVETGLTLRQAQRLLVAAESAKLSGAATTTIVIRNFGDSKNRITATVDADGNRTAVTYDLT